MKKSSPRRRAALLAVILLTAALVLLWYTRPRTLADIGLSPARCQSVQVWLDDEQGGGQKGPLVITPGDPAWSSLLDLLETGTFRRSLRDLFPRGTWVHNPAEGGHRWTIDLLFDDTAMPDGTTGSGVLLSLNCFYGKLEIDFGGDTHQYQTPRQWEEALWTCFLSVQK